MTYRDWKTVYIDKSKPFDAWRAEKDAQYRADSLTSTVPRGNVDKTFDLQRFGGQKLPEGNYNLTLRRQVQNRHIEGTKEYAEYAKRLSEKNLMPSKMRADADCQALIKKFHGKGIYDPNFKDESPREKVDTCEFIGQYWDKDENKFADTTWIKIVYSKHGAHIYPIRPEGD